MSLLTKIKCLIDEVFSSEIFAFFPALKKQRKCRVKCEIKHLLLHWSLGNQKKFLHFVHSFLPDPAFTEFSNIIFLLYEKSNQFFFQVVLSTNYPPPKRCSKRRSFHVVISEYLSDSCKFFSSLSFPASKACSGIFLPQQQKISAKHTYAFW